MRNIGHEIVEFWTEYGVTYVPGTESVESLAESWRERLAGEGSA